MSPIHRFRNAGFALFVLAVSLLYLGSAVTLGPPVVASRLSPSFFPLVLGSLSSLLSLALVIRIVKTNRTDETVFARSEPASRDGRRRAFSVIAATGVFVLLFQTLGFFVSTVPYVFAIVVIFSDRQELVRKLIYSLLIASAGYVIFTIIFNVRLPTLGG